jgi:hypothetical protein
MQKRTAAQNLAEAADRALGASAEREDLLSFLQRHVQPRPRVNWTLDGHEYLRAIAEDRSRVVVIEKAAQVGASTLMIGELLQLCLGGHKAGYFLDTQRRMQRFVQSRIDPIINSSDELVRQVVEGRWEPTGNRPKRRGGQSADNVAVKHIGSGTALFLSTKVMAEVRSEDLDAIYMDEVAELDDAIAEFAQDRLLHSDLKLQRWLSQPDVPGMDIDDWFHRSDQKYWTFRCRRCRAWSALELSFPECLIEVKGEWKIVCPRCHGPLDRESPQWVAQEPGRDISGYHISQLYGAHVTAAEIAADWTRAQSKPNRMARFQISILGKPYAGDRQPITDELLNTRCGAWGMSATGQGDVPAGLAFAGIDQGDLNHLWIGRLSDGMIRTVWLEETPSWELIEKRLRDHRVSMFVGDAMPYKTEMKRLIRKLRTGAMLYTSAKRTIYGIDDAETEPVHTVNTDRTELMDELVDALNAGTLLLPKASLPETQQAREHLKRFIKDKRDDGSFAYRRNVDNHYGMAMAAGLLAANALRALNLAPAGHFHGEMTGQRSRHIVGERLAPQRW